ncbi:hypothetical protein ACFQE5_11755 [Pseudonocardia hispaniensis]|uniref:Polysaccharide deacetylase n=1 Tax=Pseudonocardia hispaniensis TaxID=904933 RepID=A0ABW1J334_9PSEU
MTSTELAPARMRSTPGAAPAGSGVALRQLVIAADEKDLGLAAWKSILDRIGTPYDVILATSDPITPSRLVRADGVGRYQAVLLTDNALLLPDGNGNFTSALTAEGWNALWEYERNFKVRQVSLKSSPGTFPEDNCLRPGTDGPVAADPVMATLTDLGSTIFDYLKPGARIPIQNSYLYRTQFAQPCNAQPLLTLGTDVLGFVSTATDGRERAGLTFSMGENQIVTDLLGYGLLRWATRGVFLGEHRHWMNVDVDDWFASTLRGSPDGSAGTFRLSGSDAASVGRQQAALRERYPLVGDFTLNIAFNGAHLNSQAPAQCDSANTPDALSSYSRCLAREFRWINHTFSHPAMNDTPYDENRTQIEKNLEAASSVGLPVPATVLKTPEYSGLGVFNADPRSLSSPTDHGLNKSNTTLLTAAKDAGVKYLHGNMSFASHRPPCFNCGTYHPLQPDLFIVPDWPTNIAFEATTPEEQVHLYNMVYGANGGAADHADHDLTYDEILDAESNIALRHAMSGSVYTHTLHQGNLHEYASGRSLMFDWLNAVLAKYSSYYDVPLKNPDWPALASYVQARSSHFAELAGGHDAVWNRVTGAISYTPTGDNSLFFTGVAAEQPTGADRNRIQEAEMYGSDSIARVAVTAADEVTLFARPRP